MPDKTCPVSDNIHKLNTFIDSGALTNPRDRRRVEDLLALLRDIAWGCADSEHVAAMDTLAQKLEQEGKTDSSIKMSCGK